MCVCDGTFMNWHISCVLCVIIAHSCALTDQKLVIRDDVCVFSDCGVKERIMDTLMHFNGAWLRLGLETVFGQVIPCKAGAERCVN